MTQSKNFQLLGLSLLVGIIFSTFFVNAVPGISVSIFVLIAYGVFFILHKDTIDRYHWFAWFLSGTAILLSLTFALFHFRSLMVINAFLIAGLFVLSALLFTRKATYEWYDWKIAWDIFPRSFGLTLENMFKPVRILRTVSTGRENAWKQVLWGILLSLPLLVIVIVLLSSADQVFKEVFDKPLELWRSIDGAVLVLKVVLAAIIGALAGGFFWVLLSDRRDEFNAYRPLSMSHQHAILALTMLVMLNIVYLIFAVIQFSYLFAGESTVFLENYTYAEYARKGFAELVIVSLINLALVFGVTLMVSTRRTAVDITNRILLSLTVAFTLIMLYSAHFRLSLYEDAYGFTYARVNAHAFMVFILLLLLVAGTKVWSKKIILPKILIPLALAFYVGFSFVDVDKIVIEHNLERYANSGKLDAHYLHRMEAGALEFMPPLLEEPAYEAQIRTLYADYYNRVQGEKYEGWQTYNVARARTRAVIETALGN